jgi:hypothetical protein
VPIFLTLRVTIYRTFSYLKETSHDQPCFLLFILRLLGYRFRPNTPIIRLHRKREYMKLYSVRRGSPSRSKLSTVCGQFLSPVCVPELGHTRHICGILFETTKKIEVGVTFHTALFSSLRGSSTSILGRQPVSLRRVGPFCPLPLS